MKDEKKTKKQIKNELVKLGQRIAGLEALENERKRAEEALRKSEETARQLSQENAIMAEIGRIINSTLNIEEVYEHFAEEVRKLLSFDRIAIDINNFRENTFTAPYISGIELSGYETGNVIPMAGTPNEVVTRTKSSLIIEVEDVDWLSKRFPQISIVYNAGLRSMMAVPLISKDVVIGVLFLSSKIFKAYKERDLRLAENIALQIAGAIANAQLFAERKRAEEALLASEGRLRHLFDDAPVGYHEFDTEGRITRVNRTELEMLGYTAEEMLGRYIWDFIVEEVSREAVKAKLAGKLPPGRAFERTYQRKDGTTFPVLIEDRLIKDGKGRITGIRTTIQDITERKRAEEALQRSEEKAKRMAQENAIIAEIGQIISSTLEIEKVYELFAEEVRKVIPFDRIAINILYSERDAYVSAYIAGKDVTGHRPGDIIRLAGSLTEEVARTRSSMFIQKDDIDEVVGMFPGLLPNFKAGLRSLIAVPLISKDQGIGVLHVQSTKPNAYTERDLRLAERVGNQIAGAIANAQLLIERKRVEEARRKTEEHFRKVIEDIFRFVPEALLVFTDKVSLFKHNKAFRDIVQEYSGKLNYTEEELAETILKEVKNRIASGDRTEIRIPKKQE